MLSLRRFCQYRNIQCVRRTLCSKDGTGSDDHGTPSNKKDKSMSESGHKDLIQREDKEVVVKADSDVASEEKSLSKAEHSEVGSAKEPKRAPSIDDVKPAWAIFKSEFTSVGPLGRLRVPRETDVLVIGGGIIGSSVAYWLKTKHPTACTVTVIEKDPTYSKASTSLSAGGLRTQFSCPENIQMSLATIDFMRNLQENLNIPDREDPPDVCFNQHGYLVLASKDGVGTMKENYSTHVNHGAEVELLTRDQLGAQFPWLNTDDIELASYGVAQEGSFDPWSLMEGLKRKAISLGATYVQGEVVSFELQENVGRDAGGGKVVFNRLQDAIVYANDDNTLYPVRSAIIINCAGPQAGYVAKLAGIGEGTGNLRMPLPVQPRKRFVYVFHCPDGPGIDCPFVVDKSGVYFRREGMGGNYLCGSSPPSEDDEPDSSNLDVDYDFFNNYIWPMLAHRVPAFESLKLKAAWAGYYDYNFIDQNLIIGQHPHHRNFYFANGSSGHGAQHAIAIGRAISEHILEDEYKTIDLSRFSFDRFMLNDLVKEKNIY